MPPLAVIAADEPPEAERGRKREGAYRTISEVAGDLALPQHVLRFWESRFSQIRPLKRAGGRRYYRPDDIDLIRGIRHLLQDRGYTIKGAQRVLRESGLRFVQAVGRGEAEADTPLLQDREGAAVEPEAARIQAAQEPVQDPSQLPLHGPLQVPGQEPALVSAHGLREVLRDLRACRDLLAELRAGPAEDP